MVSIVALLETVFSTDLVDVDPGQSGGITENEALLSMNAADPGWKSQGNSVQGFLSRGCCC